MKAITPVIALVMLMLVTVGIVGASYTWFGGLVSSSTKKSISIPPGGAYCADGDIKIYALNNGDTTLTASDIIVAQVDGVDIKNTPFFGDMKSGLVGYWKFDEAGGTTAADSSGVVPPNDGTLIGNPQRVVGKARNALKFDPGDGGDYLNMGNGGPALSEIAGNKFTVEAWIKPSDLATTKFIAIKNGPFQFLISGNVLMGYILAGGGWLSTTGTIPLSANEWSHAALTYDGSKTSLYVNGKFDNSRTQSGSLAGDGCVLVGVYSDGSCGNALSSYFNGAIDEVKIYNKAAGDVNIQPGASGLVVNYPGVEGKHTIRVGTSSGIAEASVTCN